LYCDKVSSRFCIISMYNILHIQFVSYAIFLCFLPAESLPR
jgi:hypothetical protein